MISIQSLINQQQLFETELQKRFMDETLVIKTLQKYDQWKEKLSNLELLRQKKNDFNKIVITLSGDAKTEAIKEMKHTSDQITELEEKTKALHTELERLLARIPNLTWQGIPIGKGDTANLETGTFGVKPEFTDFEPKPYYELPVFQRDYLAQKGVEAAGFRGYYITGKLAKLQQVMFSYVLEKLIAQGFDYVIPPILVNEELLFGTGFFPTSMEDIFEVKEGDKSKYLVGTSEAPLMFLHSNQTLDLTNPIRLTAYTPCFRKEIGTYGKDTKGGIRVHQFDKIETVFLTSPETSSQVFEQMTEIFHQTLNDFGIFYHDLEVGSGDISVKNHRQIDIEGWFPGLQTFRELASSSNCTDYQTRTLNIKCKVIDGEPVYAHSLNCTGITNRTLFCILEQFQDKYGRVKVPEVLVKKFGKEFLE
jgi:seryl-tRNA synthetase